MCTEIFVHSEEERLHTGGTGVLKSDHRRDFGQMRCQIYGPFNFSVD